MRARQRILGYRSHQVLAYVYDSMENGGRAPSYDMICDTLGIATRGEVSRIVASLERRALLSRVGQGRVRRISLPA